MPLKKSAAPAKPRSDRPPASYKVMLSSKDEAASQGKVDGEVAFVISESIAHLTVVTARLFDRTLSSRLKNFDIPIGQWPFLLFLWANENLSQRQLSQRMAIEESTVAGTISRMERDGLIVRTPAPDNLRRNQLKLTKRGWQLKEQLLAESRGVVEMATQDMSEMEIAFLKTLLRKVQSNLTDKSSPALPKA
jgi:DNA-binding MarR family transcriptional regulator